MAVNNTKKSKKNLLQTIGFLMIMIGVVVFIVGFILQFSAVTSSFDSFEEPKNYISVIVTGFMIIFFGGFLNIIATVLKAKTISGAVMEKVVESMTGQPQETHERMREPEETYCDYCGTLLHEHERECPNCGANKTKK